MHAPVFPDSVAVRGAYASGIPAIVALFRASEEADGGEALLTVEDVESDWEITGFDPAFDAVMAMKGERLVAYAEVPGWRAQATVHPDERGRGIGSAILAWTEHRARRRSPDGAELRVGQTVPDTNRAAIDLFRRHGYERRHTSWVLRLPDGVTIEDRPLPDGIVIRPFRRDEEEYAVYRVVEDAFNEWPTRDPSPYVDWQAIVTRRADFDPSLLLIAATADEVVGVAFGIPYEDEGWVQQLAVRADQRGRGLAKALLRASFEEFRGRGFPAVGLSTDSRTGALDLYRSVGMVVRASYTHWSKVLA